MFVTPFRFPAKISMFSSAVLIGFLLTSCGESTETATTQTTVASVPTASTPTAPIPETPITPTPIPSPTLALERPVIAGVNNGNDYRLSWSDANAVEYRVLFWDVNNELSESVTSEEVAIISAAQRTHGGTVVVEALDARGNSLFSSPIAVEAL